MSPEELDLTLKLTDAAENYMRIKGMDDNEMVSDWIVVVHTSSLDEMDDKHRYYVLFSNGAMPEHVAVGLLTKAGDLLRSGEIAEG